MNGMQNVTKYFVTAFIVIITFVYLGCTSVKGTGGNSVHGNGGDGISGTVTTTQDTKVKVPIDIKPYKP